MRFEIRDSRADRDKPHELVITYYESPDGKTCHSSVTAMTHEELVELAHVCEAHLLKAMARIPVALPSPRAHARTREAGDVYPQEYSLTDPEGV